MCFRRYTIKRMSALILALLIVAAAFAGCSDSKDDTKSNAYGWVNHYLSAAPSSLNQYSGSETNNSTIMGLCTGAMYSLLFAEDGSGTEMTPIIASEMPIQLDTEGKQWQINIRKDYKWSNGDELNANDIIYSLQMLLDPEMYNLTASTATSAYSCPVGFYEYQQGDIDWSKVGVQMKDNYTILVTTENPTDQINVAEFFAMRVTAPVYKPYFEAGMSEDRSVTVYGTDVDNFMSCGPFMLTEWIPDGKVTVARNPYWPYSDRIKIEGIKYQIIPDSNTAMEIFLLGDIDFVELDYALWESYEDDPRVYEYFDDSLMYMFINDGNPTQNGIMGNRNFRDAIYWGTDRVHLAEVINSYPVSRYIRNSVVGDPNTGTRYIDMPGATYFIDDPYNMYDPEKANASLAKALEECSLASCTFELMYPETSTQGRARNELIQKQYADTFAGKLEIKLRTVPSGQTTALRRWNPDNPTSYEGTIGSLYPSAADPIYSFTYFTSGYNPPRFKWTSEEFDALYARAESREAMNDLDLKLELCYKMEKMLLDERVIIPMYETPTKVLFNDRIKLPVESFVLGFGLSDGAGFGFPMYVSIVE